MKIVEGADTERPYFAVSKQLSVHRWGISTSARLL